MYDLRYLHQIDINLTDLCNKTCSFCPRHSPEVYPNNNQHMSVGLFEKVIRECLEQGYDKDILVVEENLLHIETTKLYLNYYIILTERGKLV